MEAEAMSATRPRWLAVALALSMLTMGTAFLPASGAQTEDCPPNHTVKEDDGWIVLANPDENPNRRVSRAAHHFVFTGEGLENDLGRDFTNGIDAYVVDLQCETESSSTVCVRRAQTDFGLADEGLELFEFRNSESTSPDIRVAYYNDDVEHMETWDPDVPTLTPTLKDGDIICQPTKAGANPPPAGAQYAVVFLTSGNPVGVQIDNQPYGPYTSHFDLFYCLNSNGNCVDFLPDDS